MTRIVFAFAAAVFFADTALPQDRPSEVFSGPQVSEALPGFSMKLALGGRLGSDIDFVTDAKNSTVVIVFIHQLTRPSFALANAVMKYCQDAKSDDLHQGICFLAQDPTQAQTQIDRATRYFPKDTYVGYSLDGIEGPGAYGLNRNVQVTVLVGQHSKVLANFALIQPSVQADGSKILDAIANAVDAADKPDISDYLPNNQAAQDAPVAIDPVLMTAVRRLSQKDADEASVAKAIDEIEKLIKNKKPLQQQLSSIANRWVRSRKIEDIGTRQQQAKIRTWVRKPSVAGELNTARMQRDEKLTGLLRNLIQKTNTDSEVNKAAKAIEDYIENSNTAAAELKRISTTVAYGGKLENYGTKHCQKILKAWADRFKDASPPQ